MQLAQLTKHSKAFTENQTHDPNKCSVALCKPRTPLLRASHEFEYHMFDGNAIKYCLY